MRKRRKANPTERTLHDDDEDGEDDDDENDDAGHCEVEATLSEQSIDEDVDEKEENDVDCAHRK